MEQGGEKENIRLFLQWILSYVVVLLIPMLACSLIYGVSAGALKRELRQTNQQLVLQMQSKMDSVFDAMFRLGGELGKNEQLASLAQEDLSREELLSAGSSYRVYSVLESMKQVQEDNIYNSRYFVLFHGANVVMDEQSVNPADVFRKYNFENISYDAWLDFMKTEKGFVSLSNGEDSEFLYLQQTQHMTVCVMLGKAELSRILNQAQYAEHFFTSDLQGNVLTRGDQVKVQELAQEAGFQKSSGAFDTRSSVVFYAKMEQAPFLIGLQMPLNIYKNTNLLWITLLIVLLCIAVSLVLIYFLAKKNVRPLSRIIRLFGGGERQIGNAYDYIYREAQHTITENRETQQKLSSQTEVLQAQSGIMQKIFFDRLLSGDTRGILSLTDSMQQSGVSFKSYWFCAVIFYLEQMTDAQEQKQEGDLPQAFAQKIGGLFETVGADRYQAFVYKFHNMAVAVINFHEEPRGSARELLGDDIGTVLDGLAMEFTVAAGDICHPMNQLCVSYQHAFLALENKNADRDSDILWYDNIKDTVSPVLYYPIDQEQLLIAALKSGNEPEAMDRFNELWDKNRSENRSGRYSRLMISNLTNTILKVCYELETSRNLELTQHIQLDETVYTMPSREAYDCLKKAIRYVCEVMGNEKKGGKSQAVVKQIFAFIDQNFWDANLSITTLGEQFGFSPYYLSRVVKEEYPEGVMHYVHSKRVDMAKRLLREGNHNIDEIVKLTGYTNRTSFTRIFKKFEHMPPSQYQ